ncbi:rRNA 2'-O-methyltransferase fibrillarin-like protein [Aspergillus undulatus]|uniref:rRNA 2'-O-methyltransferase fibrillarin-like protein n=1 Tax=Aspergillus undulatus TaxID=1810928 RepID=UPI003CCCA243
MARGAPNGFVDQTTSRTITGLRRWSIINRDLPREAFWVSSFHRQTLCANHLSAILAASQPKAIHVYDFDNTLFLSPLPNPQLWNGPSIGFLQAYESFANGGWWHDSNLLAATGDGLEKEEPRAWKGWWNERIVQLVELSMKQKDAVTVLLTGRGEANFSDIIKRIVESRNLEFDLICLKPEVGPNGQRFPSTMDFKQNFLSDIIFTYDQAEEIRVYEDRPKHVKGFRDFFEALNRNFQSSDVPGSRRPITAEVIQVYEGSKYLSPVIEAAEVQRMINSHNVATRNPALNPTKSPYGRLGIKRTTYFTGYLIPNSDSERLIKQLLSPLLPHGLADSNDLKYMANSILIAPRPASRQILDKVGGIGKKLNWVVTGTGVFENRAWAARLQPVPNTERYHTENRVPYVVLAIRKGARPIDASKIHNWHPVPHDKALNIESVVGEKVVLRIEEDGQGDSEAQFMNRSSKRRHQQERDDDILYPDQSNPDGPQGRQHNYHQRGGGNNRHAHDDGHRRGGGGGGYRGRGRGGGARGRGNYAGSHRGGGRGRGRGRDAGPPGYRSLDDHSAHEGGGGYDEKPGPNSGGGPVMNY